MFENEKLQFGQFKKNDGSRDVFDPKKEVKEIRNRETDDEDSPTKREKNDIHRERLADFKRKLANQWLGIAETRAQLKEFVIAKPEITKEDLKNELECHFKDNDMSIWQIEEISKDISTVLAQRDLVDSFFKNVCIDKSGEEIFDYIFGIKPNGKIFLEKASFAPVVIFDDYSDFMNICSLIDKSMEDNADKIEGCALSTEDPNFNTRDFGGKLILFPSVESYQKKGNLRHETRHIFDMLISEEDGCVPSELIQKTISDFMSRIDSMSDNELNGLSEEELIDMLASLAEKSFTYFRIGNERLVKKEILAFYEQGVDSNSIKYFFGHPDGGYQIMDENLKQKSAGLLSEFLPMLKKEGGELADMFVSRYFAKYDAQEAIHSRNFNNAFKSISNLEKIGFDKKNIIAIFEKRPLSEWGKIYSRITESDEYKVRFIRDSIEVTSNILQREKEKLEDAKKYLIETESEFGNPSEKSRMYNNWKVTKDLFKNEDDYMTWLGKQVDYGRSVVEKYQKEIDAREAELLRLKSELKSFEN
jgi:hypothetical protein